MVLLRGMPGGLGLGRALGTGRVSAGERLQQRSQQSAQHHAAAYSQTAHLAHARERASDLASPCETLRARRLTASFFLLCARQLRRLRYGLLFLYVGPATRLPPDGRQDSWSTAAAEGLRGAAEVLRPRGVPRAATAASGDSVWSSRWRRCCK